MKHFSTHDLRNSGETPGTTRHIGQCALARQLATFTNRLNIPLITARTTAVHPFDQAHPGAAFPRRWVRGTPSAESGKHCLEKFHISTLRNSSRKTNFLNIAIIVIVITIIVSVIITVTIIAIAPLLLLSTRPCPLSEGCLLLSPRRPSGHPCRRARARGRFSAESATCL